jgi:hypothetical protein
MPDDTPKPKRAAKPKAAKAAAVDRPLTEAELFYVQHHCGTKSAEEMAAAVGKPACEITPAAKEFLLANRPPAGGPVVYAPAKALADQATAHTRRGSAGSFEQFRTPPPGPKK